MMDTFILSLSVICAGGIFALSTYRLFRLMKAGYIVLTLAGSLLGLYAVATALQSDEVVTFSRSWLHLFTLSFSLDSLSAFFLIPIFGICPLAALYNFHYMDKAADSGRVATNYLFLTLLMISMALVATADNILSFAVSWEFMSLSSFFLVMYDYQKQETRQAGYIYILFTQAGAMFLFAALALGYSYSGSFALSSFSTLPDNIKITVFLLALVCFGSKAGVFPVHSWLPHAHPAAPSAISGVMSGVMIKMGVYGIIRLYAILDTTGILFGQVVLVLGMISGVLGVVYALGKQDLKKVLAYSSVENIGIILIGAGIGMIGVAVDDMVMACFGFAGSLLHVFNHSLFKSLLFFGAGSVLHGTGTKNIDQLGGLVKRMTATGKSFLFGSLAISGLPPFNGFISEFLIYFGAFHGLTQKGSTFILILLAIIALAFIGGLAICCFSRVFGLAFLGEPRSREASEAHDTGFSMTFPMVVLSAVCLLIGLFPDPFVQMAMMGLKGISNLGLVEQPVVITVTRNLGFAARIFVGMFLFTMLLRKAFYRSKEIGSGSTWGCGFTQPTVRMQYTGTSYGMSIIDFFRPFVQVRTNYSGISRIFPGRTTYETRVDDIAETTLIDRIVTPFVFLLGKFRWIQHGHIQLYISYIIVTIIVLLLFV